MTELQRKSNLTRMRWPFSTRNSQGQNTRIVNIFGVVARPAAGKDTVGEAAQEHFPKSRIAVVSPGANLRGETDALAHSGFTPRQLKEIDHVQRTGGNVKNRYIVPIMLEAIRGEIEDKGKDNVILAGWPRRPRQLLALQHWFRHEQKKAGIAGRIRFVHLQIDESQANDRIAGRNRGADDASKEAVRQRHKEFNTNALPMLALLRLQGIFRRPNSRLISIDARPSKEEVVKRFNEVLEPLLAQ